MDGSKLHDLCAERGTTLGRFCKDNGLNLSTVYAIANYQNDPDGARVSLMWRIARGLGMTLDELIAELGGIDGEE